MDPRLSRAYGALAGLALGDALGMPTQAMSPQQIRTVYGRVTGLVDADASQPYAPGMAAGSVTDDTEQALLVASLLVASRGSSARVTLDAHEFAHALLAWEDSMIERGSLDLLGPSTKAALERVRGGEDPLAVGGEGTTNGAAMRVTSRCRPPIRRPSRTPCGRRAASRTRRGRASSRRRSWRPQCPWGSTLHARRPRT